MEKSQTLEQSTNELTNQPTNQPTDQSTNQSTNKSINHIRLIINLLDDLIINCDIVIKRYINDYFTLLPVPDEIKKIHKSLTRYRKCLSNDLSLSDKEIVDFHINIFKLILDNINIKIVDDIVRGSDDWLLNPKFDISIVYGSPQGIVSKIAIHFSKIYRLAIQSKLYHEKRMKEMPGEIQPNGSEKSHLILLYRLYSIFKHVCILYPDKQYFSLEHIDKTIQQLNNTIFKRLNPRNVPDINSLLNVGFQLFDKFPEFQKIEKNKIRSAFDRIIGKNSIHNIYNDISNINNTGEEVNPSTIFSRIINNLDVSSFKDVLEDIKEAAQNISTETQTSDSSVNTSNTEETIIEETIIEETVEEIIEDDNDV